MLTFSNLVRIIDDSYTGRSMAFTIRAAGLIAPMQLTPMYLRGESAQYIAAAVLSVNQVGE